jgi:hypothetical protein
MKQLTPVRMMKINFEEVSKAELKGATVDELKAILGRKRGLRKGCLRRS